MTAVNYMFKYDAAIATDVISAISTALLGVSLLA